MKQNTTNRNRIFKMFLYFITFKNKILNSNKIQKIQNCIFKCPDDGLIFKKSNYLLLAHNSNYK